MKKISEKQLSYKKYFLTGFLLNTLILGGCDSFRNALGLDHSSPNEWNTAEPSPGLILPPDFASRPKLPPPTPGKPNPHAIPETAKAQKTILGDVYHIDSARTSTQGEKELIEKASENQEVPADIRKKVDEEAQMDGNVSEKIITQIKNWKKEASENLTLSRPNTTDQKVENNLDAGKNTTPPEKEGE